MSSNSKKPARSPKSLWVECESKSQPGKFYLFNKTTGESRWLSPSKQRPEKMPMKSEQTFSTPANERLKRLQTDLRKEKVIKKTTVDNEAGKTRRKLNSLKNGQLSKAKTMLLKKESLSKEESQKLQKNVQKDKIKNKLPKTDDRTSNQHENLKPKEKSENNNANTKQLKRKRSTTESFIKENASKTEKSKTKINEIIFSGIKRILLAQSDDEQETPRPSKRISKYEMQKTPVKEILDTPELKFLVNTPQIDVASTSHLKGTANKRLERLRDSLQNEIKSIASPITNDSKLNIDKNSNTFNNSNFESEAMDWEPTEEPSSIWGLELPQISNTFFDESTDMEVDENLMLVAAEEKKQTQSNEKKWRKEFLYIVLDTNIFIRHLNFINQLRKEKIIDAPGLILYLPYSVLQELDKLKMRDKTKLPAILAIKYLNQIFESKDENMQAQSALEENNHLIEIASSDDSVLNCCLQVLEHIPKVLLFTEDVNLRNKAICNKIKTTTKSDLLKKQFQQSSLDSDYAKIW